MTRTNDHDLLVRIDERMGSVIKKIDCHSKQIANLYSENNETKDWQRTHDTKEKMVIAMASSIGGFFVFIATRVIDWFIDKKI